MKKPWLAYLLNFLFPGLGFVYLDQWGWVVGDFLVTFAVAVVIYQLRSRLGPSVMNVIPVIISVINGSIAMNYAKTQNQKRETAAAPPAPPAAPAA